MNERERQACLGMADWLTALSVQGRTTSCVLVIFALAVLLPDWSSNPALHWTTRAIAATSLVFWPIERVLCLRLQFDARLFSALGEMRFAGADALDLALADIGVRKSAGSPPRSVAARIAATHKLWHRYVAILALQFIATILPTALLVGSAVLRTGT